MHLVRQEFINLMHRRPPGGRAILQDRESDSKYDSLLPTLAKIAKPPARATGYTPIRWMLAFSSAEAAGEVYQRFELMRSTCSRLASDPVLRDLDIRPFVAGGQAAVGSQHVERQMASAAVRIRQSETAAAAAAPAAVQEVDHHMAQEMGGLNLLADARGDNQGLGQPERPTVVRRLFDHPAGQMQPQLEQRVESAPMQIAPQQSPPARPSPPTQSNPQPHSPYQHVQSPYGALPPSGGPMGTLPMPPQYAYGPYSYGPSSYWPPPCPFSHYPPPPRRNTTSGTRISTPPQQRTRAPLTCRLPLRARLLILRSSTVTRRRLHVASESLLPQPNARQRVTRVSQMRQRATTTEWSTCSNRSTKRRRGAARIV
ncbi:MAG: hypothetical protein P4L83_11625, partial [Nevskia sp.]|nr:hypothetical protein [Nevskia sp.]